LKNIIKFKKMLTLVHLGVEFTLNFSNDFEFRDKFFIDINGVKNLKLLNVNFEINSLFLK